MGSQQVRYIISCSDIYLKHQQNYETNYVTAILLAKTMSHDTQYFVNMHEHAIWQPFLLVANKAIWVDLLIPIQPCFSIESIYHTLFPPVAFAVDSHWEVMLTRWTPSCSCPSLTTSSQHQLIRRSLFGMHAR